MLNDDKLIATVRDGLMQSWLEQSPGTQPHSAWPEKASNEARDFVRMMQAYEAAKKP